MLYRIFRRNQFFISMKTRNGSVESWILITIIAGAAILGAAYFLMYRGNTTPSQTTEQQENQTSTTDLGQKNPLVDRLRNTASLELVLNVESVSWGQSDYTASNKDELIQGNVAEVVRGKPSKSGKEVKVGDEISVAMRCHQDNPDYGYGPGEYPYPSCSKVRKAARVRVWLNYDGDGRIGRGIAPIDLAIEPITNL